MYNRCKDTHKFGNKYLPLAYKTQVDFRSHFSGEKSVSYSLRNTVIASLCNFGSWDTEGLRNGVRP